MIALPPQLTEVLPRVLRPDLDGRYELLAGPCALARQIQGIDVRWSGARDVELVSLEWVLGPRREVVRGSERCALRHPIWVPPQASIRLVVQVLGGTSSSRVEVRLHVDDVAAVVPARAA